VCGLGGLELDQLTDRVDQRQMRERLRVVPQVLPADGVELFGVQVQRAGQRQEFVAQAARAPVLADEG
jgi:hypothetical protein